MFYQTTMIRTLFVLLIAAALMCLGACSAVKPYQKVHLNQEDMLLKPQKLSVFDSNFLSYREGAAGGNAGKSGGGCGCN